MMGLLDNVLENNAFQLGMSILSNNRYGDNANLAVGQGFQDWTRQNSLRAQQNRANAQGRRYEQEQQMRQQQWEQQQTQYQQKLKQQEAQKQQVSQYVAKNMPQYSNLPYAQQTELLSASMKSKFPKASTFGTTPHFDAQGNAYQLSSGGGSRKVGVPLQKPLYQMNVGGQQFGLNPMTNQPQGPIYQQTLKPSEKPEYKSLVKSAEAEGKALGAAKTELADRASTLPRLQQVVDELSVLGKKATYTKTGQYANAAKRQLGLDVGEGAIARKEYISKVDNEILPLLRQTFGAAFTAAEGESLKATLGDPNASPAEKDAVLRSFIDSKTESINTLKRRTGGTIPIPNNSGWSVEEIK